MRKIETKRDIESRQIWPNYEDAAGRLLRPARGKAFDCVLAKLSEYQRLLD